MHVAQISFFLDPQERSPAQILTDWSALVDVADMAAQAGARVSVIQACAQPEQLVRHGVRYHFVAPDPKQRSISGGRPFAELIRGLKADVFHVHGLGFGHDVRALAALAPGTPILLQDHADRVPRVWRRRALRRGLAAARGVAFCAREQARPFARAGLLHDALKVFEIAESSSRFAPGDKGEARLATGMQGDPAILWVGHLDANKDPLTMLAGVGAAAEQLPGLKLWCCFAQAPLLGAVRRRIQGDPRLTGRIHLLGHVPHPRIEAMMRAADLLVSASRREGSGFAVIEALACALTPVITDIPSFRALTGAGYVGALWPCGDAAALARALVRTAAIPEALRRSSVRTHFEAELSFAAVGRKLLAAYADLLSPKTTAGAAAAPARRANP